MSELPPEAAPEPAAVRPGTGRSLGALAGALGAATSLAVLEVAALLDPDGSSVLESVGNRVIDSFAASLKDVAVAIFGTSDKAALQIGTVVIALAIGAWLGSWLDRRPAVLLGGFAAFGAFGTWATAVDPQGSAVLALVACAVAALAGATVALGLHGRWSRGTPDAAEPALDRRAVLVRGGVVLGVLAVGAAVARSVRDGIRESRLSQAVARRGPIPSAATVVSAPEGTLDQPGPDQVEGISPYLTPVDDFFRIDTALRVPVVDVDRWRLAVTGMVDRPLELSYDDLLARELIEVPITIQCVSNEVGGDLVGTASWRGVRLAEVLREAGVQGGAEQLVGESVDGFTAGFPVEAALDGRDALIAVAMDGRPLPPEHGFPVRLIVPGLYGYVSATKWLRRIELTTLEAADGYWIPRGWAKEAPIKTQCRIDTPRGDQGAGRVPVAGVAWAPTRGISKVEVQVDEGPWEAARLGPGTNDDRWVQWVYDWRPTPGRYRLRARATDGAGDTQTADVAPPAPDGATGYPTRVVNVS